GTYRLARTVEISGEVVDANGLVDRAHVVLTPVLGDDLAPRAIAEQSTTDAEGRFRFEGLGARAYVLRAHGAESVARSMLVDASGGDVALHVVLEPGTLVFVRFDRAFPIEAGTGAEHTIAVFDAGHAL